MVLTQDVFVTMHKLLSLSGPISSPVDRKRNRILRISYAESECLEPSPHVQKALNEPAVIIAVLRTAFPPFKGRHVCPVSALHSERSEHLPQPRHHLEPPSASPSPWY